MEKAVLVRYDEDSDGYPAGAMVEVVTAARAREVHPNARIIRYADGSAYESEENDDED